ncbi:MAG TPA: DUF1775 domain-containing protein [Candidatus Tectomicrobia bacterium]|nr:DUF1775 domain-containing protein [Candidatus Tectomicrobia bacterium]
MNDCHRNRRVVGVLGLILLTSFSATWAHIDIEPKETIPSRWETFILNVPTEAESPTVEVQLAIPEGFEVEAVGHRTDWDMAVRRDARGFVREIVWSGGQIPSLTFEEFKLLGKAAKSPGPYEWQARQRYADDQESTWPLRTMVRAEGNGPPAQKAEEALKTAQVAMTISFLAIGVAAALIVVTLITIWQGARVKGRLGE